MGSWNETCQLSHLPIINYDTVTCIILVKHGDKINPCYYNENWAPLCLPIDGEYDDYGAIENVKTSDYTKEFLSSLQYTYEDNEAYEFKNIEELVKDIVHHGLYLNTDMTIGGLQKLKLACVFYHKELYDTLVADTKQRRITNMPSVILNDVYETKYEQIKTKIRKYIQCKTEIKKTKAENPNADIEIMISNAMDMSMKLHECLFKSAKFGWQFPRKYLDKKILTNDNLDKFVEELIDYIMWTKALDYGTYGYLSKCTGFCHRDVRVQRLVAKFIIDFSHRKYEDEDDEIYYEEPISWNSWDDNSPY